MKVVHQFSVKFHGGGAWLFSLRILRIFYLFLEFLMSCGSVYTFFVEHSVGHFKQETHYLTSEKASFHFFYSCIPTFILISYFDTR